MRNTNRPMRTTLLWGLICGLSFIPVNLLINCVISWPSAINMTFWLFLTGYAFLLSRWSNKSFATSVFPLSLLCLSIFLVKSVTAFFLLSLPVISWIRSGICFPKPAGIKLFVEIVLSFTGGMLIAVYTPIATFSGALGIWMLFLVQSLYFIFFDTSASAPEDAFEKDPFERASKLAEDILSHVPPG